MKIQIVSGLFSGPSLGERAFAVSAALRAETVRGRGYLEFDQRFTLLRRQPVGLGTGSEAPR